MKKARAYSHQLAVCSPCLLEQSLLQLCQLHIVTVYFAFSNEPLTSGPPEVTLTRCSLVSSNKSSEHSSLFLEVEV